MKKILILLIQFLVLNNMARAQESIGVYYQQTLDADGFAYLSINYSFGIKSNFRFTDKLALISAIGLEDNSYDRTKINPNYIRLDNLIDPMIDYVDVKLVPTIFHLRYDISNQKKISYYIFIGPTINTCIREKSIATLFGEEIIENNYRYIYNSLISIGIGFHKNIGEKLILDFETSYSIPFWTNEMASLKVYIHRLGLNIGLSYKLKK